MGYHANMNGAVQRIRSLGTDRTVGSYMASEARRLMKQFVPRRTGKLRESAIATAWRIVYTAKYAKYQYYGNYRNYTTPGTGAEWNKKLNKGDLARSMQAFIKSFLRRG